MTCNYNYNPEYQLCVLNTSKMRGPNEELFIILFMSYAAAVATTRQVSCLFTKNQLLVYNDRIFYVPRTRADHSWVFLCQLLQFFYLSPLFWRRIILADDFLATQLFYLLILFLK